MPSLQRADKGRISTSNRCYPPCLLSYEAHTCRGQTQRVSPGWQVTPAVTAARPPAPAGSPAALFPEVLHQPRPCLLALLRRRPDQSAAHGCGVTACLTGEEGTKLPSYQSSPSPRTCHVLELRCAQPILVLAKMSPSQRLCLPLTCPHPLSLFIMLLYFPQSLSPTGWQSLVPCPLSVPLQMENQGTRALLRMEHGARHREGGGPCWLNRGRLHCSHEARGPKLRQGRGAACAGPSSPGGAELRGSGQPAPSCEVPSPVCAAAVSSRGQWEHVCAVQGCYEDYGRYVQVEVRTCAEELVTKSWLLVVLLLLRALREEPGSGRVPARGASRSALLV